MTDRKPTTADPGSAIPSGSTDGKTRNAILSARLDMYFGGTSWTIGAFCSMHGDEVSPADLRNAVEEQLDKLKADVLNAVALFVYHDPPANTEEVR